ncbi:MAG TPA: hemerythrin domain-containing protein [Azonexus sp.]|nr:hemerythrin domain-containing protein [Azonexus sp.]
MRPEAIQIIKDEHSAISAVLYTLRYLVKQMREAGEAPNFPLLKAILDYIVSYPDRWHHPKEDDFLFAAVKRRTHEADQLIAGLEQEHALGYPMIADLKLRLLEFQDAPAVAAPAFYDLANRYVELEWAHMRKEEDDLLPIAERTLAPEDWAAIGQAFRENDNPLFGIKPKEEAEYLYQKILNLAPAPIGYGR